MERSKANKKKFEQRSAFKAASMGNFIQMGSFLGKSDPKTKYASIDVKKNYANNGGASAKIFGKKSDKESKLIPKEVTEDTKLEKENNFLVGDNRLDITRKKENK